MDLISGSWQVELPESEQEKCAIITSLGLYQPTCMPQGLCIAPATFQQIMESVLADLKFSCVLIYLDNINVFFKTFNEHIMHLVKSSCVFFKVILSSSQKNAISLKTALTTWASLLVKTFYCHNLINIQLLNT